MHERGGVPQLDKYPEVAGSHCILPRKVQILLLDVPTDQMTTEYKRRPRPSRPDPVSHVIAWRRRRTAAGVAETLSAAFGS